MIIWCNVGLRNQEMTVGVARMIAKRKSALEGYFKIRNLDPIVKEKLRVRAKQNGRSLSREALLILKKGVGIEDEPTPARDRLRSDPTHKRKVNRYAE